MYGLDIAECVHDEFQFQKEVPGKSRKLFEITKKVNVSAEIAKILTNLAMDCAHDCLHQRSVYTEDNAECY